METKTAAHARALQHKHLVPAEQLASFNRDGYVRLRDVLDPDTLLDYEKEISMKVKELNMQHLPLEERDTYGRAFLQVSNLWRHSEIAQELVFSRRLAAIAADLLGVRGVRLYHDQALYKESGGGITPWHADQYYWPLTSDRTVTVWIPLQNTPIDMGPLSFAKGSHEFEFGRDLSISDESEARLKEALASQTFPLDESPYSLGDVSFHLGWTFHRAGANQSGVPRAVMTMIYMDSEIKVAEPTNANQEADLKEWLGGTAPGEVPSSEFNPVLYHAS